MTRNAVIVAWLALTAYGVWITSYEWRESHRDLRALVLRVESDDVDLLIWTGLQIRLSWGRMLVQIIFLAAGLLAISRRHDPRFIVAWQSQVISWLLVVAQIVAVWLAHESRRVRQLQTTRKRRRRQAH